MIDKKAKKLIELLGVLAVSSLSFSGLAAKEIPVPKLKITKLPPMSATSIISDLNWIIKPGDNECGSLCGGYYTEPLLNPLHQKVLPMDESVTFISKAKQTRFIHNGMSTLIGSPVVMKQAGRQLSADKVYLHRSPKTGKIVSADLFGNVRVHERGKLLVGDYAHLSFKHDTGTVENALYRLSPSGATPAAKQTKKAKKVRKIFSLNAWGRAMHIDQVGKGLYKLYHASYSTCPPDRSNWHMKASRLVLNKNTGWGQAYNARLYVKNVPIFYTPYINFPIDDRRKSGFLYPGYGYSSDDGVTLSVPYYWNMAPNYDMTITPVWMNHRGVQLNDLFRYLTPESRGQIYASYLPNDHGFKRFRNNIDTAKYSGRPQSLARLQDSGANRQYLYWTDQSQWDPNWSTKLDFSYAGDDYWFEDFSSPFADSDSDQLKQQFTINYSNVHWNADVSALNYQTMHPVTQSPLASPYNQLPAFNLSGNYPDQWLGLTYSLDTQYINFNHHGTPDGGDALVTIGQRVNLEPSISLPLIKPYGYLTPEIKLMMTKYLLKDQDPNYSDSPNRTLPIFDVHGGLYFDRKTTWFNTAYRQTLEPEFYYLMVPKENQNALPLFDTSTTQISIPQMLSDNRFSGIDRMGDANQVALVLTSRFLEANSGFERLKLQVGDLIYFRNRKVMLCTTAGCEDKTNVSSTDMFSPIVMAATYKFSNVWQAKATAAFPPDSATPVSQTASIGYRRDARHIVNVGYSYTQEQAVTSVGGVETSRQDQILGDAPKLAWISMAWPVPFADRWHFLGYANYDVHNHHALGTFYGLEYNNCCWAVRAITSRDFRYEDTIGERNIYNNTFFLQFIFKGLGEFGNHNANGILTQIDNYQDPYQTSLGSYQL